jgi:hypothetical protein
VLASLKESSGQLRIAEIATNERMYEGIYIIKRDKKKDEEGAPRRILLLLPLQRGERANERKEREQ